MKLFEDHIGLVEKIVNRMNYGYVSKDDLRQAGLMGLYDAALKYKPETGVKFNTYATYYILGAIKKELRDNHLIKLNRDIYRIIREIKKTPNYLPTDIAAKLNTSTENVIIAYNYLHETASLNAARHEASGYERELVEEIPAPERRTMFSEAMENLGEVDRNIIFLRYFKNISQKEIAAGRGESQSKISRLETRALNNLRKYLSVK